MSSAPPLTWNEALSGISGSISLASWIFLLVPQLIENYTNGNADGISLTFLFIWFVGDVTNLAGAAWAGLVPTVIAIAVYFCFADGVLISQCLYYNRRNKRQTSDAAQKDGGVDGMPREETPLLAGGPPSPALKRRSLTDITEENMGLPGSRRPSHRRRTISNNSLERILEEPSRTRAWLKNSVSVGLIILAGTAGWAIAWKTGAWRPTPLGGDEEGGHTPIGAEILGYASAVCYLGARIPQIIKNARDRSCEGLSLLFFLLSLLGNLTYGGGILFHDTSPGYLRINAPWLIGSLGTMAEDAIIFVQFTIYGERDADESTIAVE